MPWSLVSPFASCSSQANRTAVIRELARLGADLEVKNDAGQVPSQLTRDRLVSGSSKNLMGLRNFPFPPPSPRLTTIMTIIHRQTIPVVMPMQLRSE